MNENLIAECVLALVNGLCDSSKDKPRRVPQYTFATDLGVDFNDINRPEDAPACED